MKKNLFRILSVMLASVMLFCIMPSSALADENALYVCGIKLTPGEYLAEKGTLATTEQPKDNYAYFFVDYDGNYCLRLYNFNRDAQAEMAIYCNKSLTVIPEGENSFTSVKGNLVQVYGNISMKGDGTLRISGGTSCSIVADEGDFSFYKGTLICDAVDSAINADGKVYIYGGSITAKSTNWEVVAAGNGIYADENIKISASENRDGTNLTDFDAEKLSSYRFIKLEYGAPLEGDVNSDGQVDVFDYYTVKSIYFDNYIPTDEEFLLADINADGQIDVFDYMAIKTICIE